MNPGVLGTPAAFRRIYEEPIVAAQQSSASLEEKELGKYARNVLFIPNFDERSFFSLIS